MTNQQFITQHRQDDVRRLALGTLPEEIDARWCLQQIEGWQLASRKLPQWAATEGLWFPPRLSLEQCSGQAAARYKCSIVERLLPTATQRRSMADLTGGFGVDFSYMAPLFGAARYYEQNAELCRIAAHNFLLLGLNQANVVCADTSVEPAWHNADHSLLYLDPARRDVGGRKTIAIEDCTPDVVAMQSGLLQSAPVVMIKLSPMLDIRMALRRLSNVSEIHIVSVKGECKELLLVLTALQAPLHIYCVNLESHDAPFVSDAAAAWAVQPKFCDEIGAFLYEPGASLLKGGVQDAVAAHHNLLKLHRDSHLYTSNTLCPDFPGRIFSVEGHCGFSKGELRSLIGDMAQANLTVRNFPATVAELRKRLKLREGGETYLFATTACGAGRVLIKCRRAAPHKSQAESGE